MSKMKTVEVNTSCNWEIVEKNIPKPERNQVRIKIKACGVCHSDAIIKNCNWPGIKYPRTPGHEVAGVIDEIGPDVTQWKKGQRVGIGWLGKYCGKCSACRHGDFIHCENKQITGIHFDGGYAEYMIAPVEGLAAIPDELSFAQAAPLLCAGITTFNALRHSSAKPGDLVAIQGVGGLGHLAIQFANKMGFKTVALSRGKDKEELAHTLGAHIYLDANHENIPKTLQKLGGAQTILGTAPSGKAISPLVEGLHDNGTLLVIGISQEPIEVSSTQLISANRSIMGWASGTSKDAEEAMKFSVLTGIQPMIEKFPLEKASEAFDRMMLNKARFRAVLIMESD